MFDWRRGAFIAVLYEVKVEQDKERSGRRRRLRCGFRKACRFRFCLHVAQNQRLPQNPRTCFEGPFGEVIRATGPMAKANPFRFSTKYQDDETELVYYGCRYYNASTGRWITRDLINENGGVSLYAFVRGNPVNRFDALGQADPNPTGWPYPDPKPGEPVPPYPPPLPLPRPPSKYFKKYDCSCCDQTEIDAGLNELKRRFGLAQAYLDKGGLPSRLGGEGPVTCAGSNERVLNFMEPTPQCWICFMDVRWDEPTYDWPRRKQWNENFIHCFTANNQGIQKEIIFDYFEHGYYHKGSGIYEDLGQYYKHHPYPGTSDAGGVPRWVNCNEPVKEWKPNYETFNEILGIKPSE